MTDEPRLASSRQPWRLNKEGRLRLAVDGTGRSILASDASSLIASIVAESDSSESREPEPDS